MEKVIRSAMFPLHPPYKHQQASDRIKREQTEMGQLKVNLLISLRLT